MQTESFRSHAVPGARFSGLTQPVAKITFKPDRAFKLSKKFRPESVGSPRSGIRASKEPSMYLG
jgi:hypothetical protein